MWSWKRPLTRFERVGAYVRDDLRILAEARADTGPHTNE